MARIRSIKPEFFTSEDVAALPLRARLTWIGLWTHCDDAGRAKDHVKLIKAAIWPLDQVSLADIEEDLSTLAEHGRILRYEVDGRRYLAITNWGEHQRISNPSKPKHPGPELSTGEGSRRPHVVLSAGSHEEGKGREQGGDARVRAAHSCPQHPNGTNEPCGACKDARVAADAVEAERRQRERDGPKCRTHRGMPAENCGLCRAEKLGAA